MSISSSNPVKNDDFHCDGNEWVAINVCLIPPTALSNIAVDLSNQLCESSLYTLRTSGIESPLQPKRGFPHVTLRQLFCHKDNIEPLCIAVQSSMKMELQTQQQQTGTSSTLCNELNMLEIVEGPVFDRQASPPGSTVTEDVLLPNIRLKKHNTILQRLHEVTMTSTNDYVATSDQVNKIIKATVVVGGEEDLSVFHPLWPGNTASHNWTASFTDMSAFERFDPHITLGAAYRSKLTSSNLNVLGNSISFPLRGSKVCISRMGNCCSCFEVLAHMDL